jgi:uncharacterized protein (TIGR03437 family)
VSIGGIPAPLFAVAPGEIEAQIPYDLAAPGQYQVIVNVSGALSAPRTIQLAPAAPGLASNADGTVIAQRWEDYALVTAASPAVPGEYLMLYLVGMGAANQPVPNGAAAPLNPPARVVSPPEVTLGGVPVTVYFAGLCPGWVGLYQINIQVPDIPNGGNLLMKVVENGIASNTAILPVRK